MPVKLPVTTWPSIAIQSLFGKCSKFDGPVRKLPAARTTKPKMSSLRGCATPEPQLRKRDCDMTLVTGNAENARPICT